MLRTTLPVGLLLGLLAGCQPDDVKTDDTAGAGDTADSGDTADTADSGADTTDTTDTSTDDTLVGGWISSGENVSYLLASFFSIVEIDATFQEDLSYTVTSLDGDGATVDYAGTYALDESTSPSGITLTQTLPSEATAMGIYAIVDGTLSYEVVQTVPDIGCTVPTAETGFGGTTCPRDSSLPAGYNVQTFVRP